MMTREEMLNEFRKLRENISVTNTISCDYCDYCYNCYNCLLCYRLKVKKEGYWVLNKEVTKDEFEKALAVFEGE